MSFFAKYRKPLNLILALITISLLLLNINLACSNCLDGSWAKILISIFTVLIAVIELGDIFPENKQKKIAMYGSLVALFLVSVWDTGKESVEYQKEVNKRDSLITVDSLRFAKIVNDLSVNIVQLEEISGSVINSLNEVINVKESIGEQKPILNNILSGTIESSEKTRKLMDDKKPRFTFYGKFTNGYINNSDSVIINVHPINAGKSKVISAQVFYQIMHLRKIDDRGNFNISLIKNCDDSENIYPKKWIKLKDILDAKITSTKMTKTLKPCLTKNDFSSLNNSWLLVYSIKGFDTFTQSEVRKTLTIHGKLGKDNKFELQYNTLSLKDIKNYFEENFNSGEYIFAEQG